MQETCYTETTAHYDQTMLSQAHLNQTKLI